MHSLGLANSDHTTLLLNTYTKLKDVSRLDSFIKTESRRPSSTGDESEELPFDLETAIRVCRQAGYFEHASYLAKKYERHEDYLRIQIEDAGNYKDALSYLRRLGPDAAEANLARYGRAMLESLPEETTQLLIDLCTSTAPLVSEVGETPTERPTSSAGPSYLSYLALNRNAVASSTAPAESSFTPPSPSVKTLKPGDTVSRRDSIHNDSRSTTPPVTPLATTATTLSIRPRLVVSVKKLSPRLYFAHFVDHMSHFVRFLETVAQRRWEQSVEEQSITIPAQHEPPTDEPADKADQIAVWNTLLELYLTLPLSTPGDKDKLKKEENTMRKKALRLLNSETIPYDPTHALILCSSRQYTPGLVLLWEKMGMHEHVLRFWMDRDKEGTPGASVEVVQRLKVYGATRRHLYPLVLRYLTSTSELLSRHTADVAEILEHVEKEKILPPLGVIQVLSRNEVASVGMVKQWLMTRIKLAREEIDTVGKDLTMRLCRTNIFCL